MALLMDLLMDLKIVKVGYIDSPSEEQTYLLSEKSSSESNEIVLDQFTWRPTSQPSVCSRRWSVHHNDDLVESDSEELELPEEGGTPDNWPNIPQLSKYRSCEANTERTNCVNRAKEHLQLLLGILTDWVQKAEEKVSEDIDVDPKLFIYDFDSEDKKDALVPMTANLVPLTSVEALKYYNNHAQLKAIVKEVMLLLAWLHHDCQKTEARLYSEKVFQTLITSKIDELNKKKLHEITAKVQWEHDIVKAKLNFGLLDISDLYRIRNENSDLLKSVQKTNFNLKKDIARRKDFIPQVKWKILQENQKIDELQNAIDEANEMWNEMLKQKVVADSNHHEAKKIVKEEQHGLDMKLNACCHKFNVVAEAAEKAEKSYYLMCKAIVDGKEKIKENEREVIILKVKLENNISDPITEITSHDEKDDLVQQVRENKVLNKRNKRDEKEIEKKRNEYIAMIDELEIRRLTLEQELKLLTQKNDAIRSNIESMQLKIQASQKQTTFYEENLKQLIQDIMKAESDAASELDELERLRQEKEALSEKVDQKLLKLKEQELSLENTIKEIKHQIATENNGYIQLTKKVSQLEFKVKSLQNENEEIKQEYEAMVDTSRATLKKLDEKLKDIITLKLQKDEVLYNLEMEKLRLMEEYKKALQDNEEYLINFIPFQQKSHEKGSELETKLEGRKQQMENFKTEMERMIKDGKAMEESMVTGNELIATMTKEMEELDSIVGISSNFLTDTKARWVQVTKRLRQEWLDHNDLMHYRSQTLEQILEDKQQSLEENERLATEYRIAQNILMQKKEQYVRLSGDTILLRQAHRDLCQLLRLQMNLQYQQIKYCQYRGTHMKQQLVYFLYTSNEDQTRSTLLRSQFTAKTKKTIKSFEDAISIIWPRKQSFLPIISKATHRWLQYKPRNSQKVSRFLVKR